MGDWVAATLVAMTFEEKISLLAGGNLWETVPIPRLGLPALKVTDGPNGRRNRGEPGRGEPEDLLV